MPTNILCITTTKPSAVLSPGAGGTGGGSITLVDPVTGSTGSSLRCHSDMAGKVPIGANSLSIFPPPFSNHHHHQQQQQHHQGGGGGSILALAFGQTSKSNEDGFAMLLSFRSSAMVAPILHWKARLPEGNLTGGLLVSPCGHYIVGGGHSGTLYVWAVIGGYLIRTSKVHYRAIQVLTWTHCGRFLATGGADGMVHVFSILDLVAYSESTGEGPYGGGGGGLQPIRTWPNHQLPVQDIVALPGGRLATAGQDGQILILEIASEAVLATLQLPYGIQSLSVGGDNSSTLFAGSVEGTIFVLSLDEYAIHKLIQQGAVAVARTASKQQSSTLTMKDGALSSVTDQVFCPSVTNNNNKSKDNNESDSTTADVYRTELKGHDRAVTSLCTCYLSPASSTTSSEDMPGATQQLVLCSGDETGTVRLWDMESRSCLRTIRPWSHGISDSNEQQQQQNPKAGSNHHHHPISSIQFVSLPSDDEQPHGRSDGGGIFNTNHKNHYSGSKRNATTVISLLPPLQKFVESSNGRRVVQVPFLSPTFQSRSRSRRCRQDSAFWDVANDSLRDRFVEDRLRVHTTRTNKQPRRMDDQEDTSANNQQQNSQHTKGDKVQGVEGDDDNEEVTTGPTDSSGNDGESSNARIDALEKELAEARNTIERWRTVNNKLIARLQQPPPGGPT
ncbi:hypothetical protein ACA910_019653 [Epithemia clementina (nom. ined.)]